MNYYNLYVGDMGYYNLYVAYMDYYNLYAGDIDYCNLYVGDLGYYNSDGYFFIVGRIKELIKYNAYQVRDNNWYLLMQTFYII